MDEFRLAVIGSRKWKDRKLAFKHLMAWYKKYGRALHIVSGGAPEGGDKIAEDFARQKGLSITLHHADWDGPAGKGAGYERNTKIADDCDAMLAFWNFDTNGTADTLTKARWHPKKYPFFVVNFLGKVFEGEEIWGGKN